MLCGFVNINDLITLQYTKWVPTINSIKVYVLVFFFAFTLLKIFDVITLTIYKVVTTLHRLSYADRESIANSLSPLSRHCVLGGVTQRCTLLFRPGLIAVCSVV